MIAALELTLRNEFSSFLEQLKLQSPQAWQVLILKLRKPVTSWLYSKVTQYPEQSLSTKQQFIEEVFEESLFKFSELLPSGTFGSYADLEALMMTVTSYKLKEGFARLKKEKRLYLMETSDLQRLVETGQSTRSEYSAEEAAMVLAAKEGIEQLNEMDREILNRFFDGEDLNDIAESLHISPEACRKRKQRALASVRAYFFKRYNK